MQRMKPMKAAIGVVLMLAPLADGADSRRQPDRQIAVDRQPLPPLIELGLAMNPDSKAVVAVCACHAPFSNVGLMGGDRIVSVDGRKVDSIESLRRALNLARPKRSFKIAYVRTLGLRALGQPHPQTVVVDLPEKWWVSILEKK